jgi:hypothetical protein
MHEVLGRHFLCWGTSNINLTAHVGRLPEGTPVVAKDLLHLAIATVDQALSLAAVGLLLSHAARTFILFGIDGCASTCSGAEMVTQSSSDSSCCQSLLARVPVASTLSA